MAPATICGRDFMRTELLVVLCRGWPAHRRIVLLGLQHGWQQNCALGKQDHVVYHHCLWLGAVTGDKGYTQEAFACQS